MPVRSRPWDGGGEGGRLVLEWCVEGGREGWGDDT